MLFTHIVTVNPKIWNVSVIGIPTLPLQRSGHKPPAVFVIPYGGKALGNSLPDVAFFVNFYLNRSLAMRLLFLSSQNS